MEPKIAGMIKFINQMEAVAAIIAISWEVTNAKK